jgi:hypothetical protein
MIEIGISPLQMIVIASAPVVSSLMARSDLNPHTKVFSDADFMTALKAIVADAPPMIALDPEFAATARGAALVARVRADPRLCGTEVRALGMEGELLAPVDVSEGTPPMLALDHCGTRRAVRYEMRPDVETRINGALGHLINLSATGAQVLGSIRLRPTETVRLMLLDESTELRLRGIVAWANMEIGVAGASRYRVGIELPDVDAQVMDCYCARNRQP